MLNIWGLPQETQDTVRLDLNVEPELPPHELPAVPIEDLPELSLQDLPENLVNLSELASQVAFEAEDQLPLTQTTNGDRGAIASQLSTFPDTDVGGGNLASW